VSFVNEWHLNPKFLANWEKRIANSTAVKFGEIDRRKIFFLFTAHSLPERIKSWSDPYQDQLLQTAEMLARNLKLLPDQYGFAFQSAGHSRVTTLLANQNLNVIVRKLGELVKGKSHEYGGIVPNGNL
jgi:protoporphyrin/coproporphyrin ferrochelatase